MSQAAAHLPSVIVDLPCLPADKARADKRSAAPPSVTKIDWANAAVATRAVDMDLKAESGDFVEGAEWESASHLVGRGPRIIGLQ